MQEKILLVDDDEKMNALLVRYLTEFGFQIHPCTRPSDALASLKTQSYDLAILDVMLPEMDGFELCRILHEKGDLPVIMLTARGEISDRVLGLELGSDDYVPKPFEPRELVARIRAVLRRHRGPSAPGDEEGLLTAGPLVMNRRSYTVSLEGRPLELTTSEFQLLEIFLSSPGTVLSRDILMDRLRGTDAGAFDRSIDILVSRLRTQLGDDPRHPRFIRTLRNLGYLFIPEHP